MNLKISIEIQFIIVAVLALISMINTCGVTTHTEIGHRAAAFYDYLLDNKISVGEVL